MGKAKKAVSIKTTIIRPMFIVLFLQVIIILVTIFFGGTTKQLKDNAYELLDSRNNKLSYNVSNFFSRFRVTDESYKNVNSKLIQLEGDSEKTVELIISEVSEDLLDVINKSNATGAFVILDNVPTKSINERTGMYIRKNGDELMLKVGSLGLVQKLELKLDNSWKETFKFSSDGIAYTKFYNEVYSKAKKSETVNYRECEYLSEPFDLNNDGIKSITYTLPLINDSGVPYGVIGVEISLNKLNEIFDDYKGYGGYNLIAYGNENNLNGISLIKDDYNVHDISLAKSSDSVYDIYKILGINIGESKENIASVKDLDIKLGEGNIKVLSVTTKEDLFSIQNELMEDLLVGLVIASLVSIIIVIFTASHVTKPITEMVNAVKKMNPSKAVKINRLGITQMDALAVSIENLGKNVSDNASKLSQIINLVNMPIGAFEYFDNSNMVYCTQSFFKVVGVSLDDSEDLFINMERFKKILSDITKNRVTNEKNVYVINKYGKESYVRVKMLISDQKTLGVVVDVTDDMLKKQKIEFERDHDVLTGLFNRIAFKREVTDYISNAPKDKIAAFLMLDLDSLKYMNDTFGHELGDEYIRKAADSINKFTKYGGVVGRIGGDEFTAFIGGFETKEQIRQIINKVKRDFDETEIELPNGERKAMRASMGVAWFPQDSIQYEELSKYADYAMYEVKKTTKGALKEFDIKTYTLNGDYDKYE